MNLLQMSLMAGILIVGIVIWRVLFVHHMPKKAMVLLWEIVILRLLFPFFLPVSLSGIGSLENTSLKTQWSQVNVSVDNMYETSLNAGTEEEPFIMSLSMQKKEWGAVFWIIYSLGVVGMTAGSFYLYFRDSQLFREGLPMPDNERRLIISAMEEEDKKRMEKVKFQVSDRTLTPVTYGIFCPAVVFPKGIYLKGEKEINFCLRHELVHIRNHDNLKKLIAHGALCLHWFNPLVWVMYFLYNRDLELLCDETVVRRKGGACRQDYAMALLSMAQQRQAGFRTGLGFGKNAVKERITAVMKFKKMTSAKAFVTGAAVMAALTVFMGPSGNTKDQAEQTQTVTIAVAEEDGVAEIVTFAAGEGTVDNTALGDTLVMDLEEETSTARLGSLTVTDWTGQEQPAEAVRESAASDMAADWTRQEQSAEAVAEEDVRDRLHSQGRTYEAGAESEEALENTVADIMQEYQQFGLRAEALGEDYQLYYEGEPIYFFADNQKKDGTGFSGRLFLRPASRENGYTGVITEYDDEGKIKGVVHLSEKESKAYTRRWQ